MLARRISRCLTIIATLTLAPAALATGAPTIQADWLAQASRAIEAIEYQASPVAGGFRAANPAHGLITRFREVGLEVAPYGAPGSGWEWTWTTRAFGRENALREASPAALLHNPRRVEYRREGWVEWYVNDPKGLEQGFTLETAPPGEGRLCIEGRVGGALELHLGPDGRAIECRDKHNREVLRYGKLIALDANGTRLPSRLDLAGRTIRILVDDRGAAYPIVIDPLLETPDWEYIGPEEHAIFGRSISTAGDVNGDGFSDVVISSVSSLVPNDRVYAFHGSPDGLSTEPHWIEDGSPGSLFGLSVAVAGDVNGDGYHDVLVSAMFHDNGDGTVGRVFCYHGSPTGLSTANWHAQSADPDTSSFGYTVATAGDVNGDGFDDVIIGEYHATGDVYDEGRALIYLGSADGLEATPVWVTEGGQETCYYGVQVSTAGDVNADGYHDVLVSAARYDTDLHDAGRAYLYLGSPTGPSTTPDWTYDGEDWAIRIGLCVANAGDTDGDGYADVLVSSFHTDTATMEGRAILFRGSPTGLEDTPAWSAYGGTEEARFGETLATAGDLNGDGLSDVVIGAHGYTGEFEMSGAAFVFYGTRDGLTPDPVWFLEGEQAGEWFGGRVATAGDVNGDGFSDLLVAGYLYDDDYEAQGRVLLFHGSGDRARTSAGWVIESNQAEVFFGWSIARAGDVNGDGIDDVLVGALGFDNGEIDEGAAFLFLGTVNGLSVLPDWWAEGDKIGAALGVSVAGAGDVNGDGYDDILIGASRYKDDFTDEGAAFLWFGSPLEMTPGTPANADWSAFGGQEGAFFGICVAAAGDVNGDGYGDAIVGAPLYSHGETEEGAAVVFHGSASGLEPFASWQDESNQTEALFGLSVASAGDVNGDGYSDILVGAPSYDASGPDNGLALCYLGSAAGVQTTPDWSKHGSDAADQLGWAVASAGDIDGDGYSDVLTGAPGYDGSKGQVRLWRGSPGGIHGTHTWTGVGATVGGRLGHRVAPAGDVNGDGYGDFIIGAPHEDNRVTGDPNCGLAWLLCGCADGVVPAAADILGIQEEAQFGWSVSAADVNGDGFSDMLVGAPYHDQGQTEEGRGFVFYGNNSRGLARNPDQVRSDFARPVALLGISDAETGFGLEAQGRTAAGRGQVWMEWEARSFGTDFSGAGIWTGTPYDTGVPDGATGSSVDIAETVIGFPPESRVIWRLRIASRNPFFPRTPWFSHSGNSRGELDLQTAPGMQDVQETRPQALDLQVACHPSPFRTSTKIRFAQSTSGPIRLTVHDLQGRQVHTLFEGRAIAGERHLEWDGTDDNGQRVARGMYYLRLTAERREVSRSIILID